MPCELSGERYRAAGRDLWVFQKQGEMIRPEEDADLIANILAQPKRTLYKNIITVPVVEQW